MMSFTMLPFFIAINILNPNIDSVSNQSESVQIPSNNNSGLEYEKATWFDFKDAAVSFTFDDGNRTHFTVAAPMLEQRGWRGTFYVVTNWVGAGDTPSWDTIVQSAQNGHEIGSHTNNHALISTITTPSLIDSAIIELSTSKQIINQHIFPEKCETLAWPGGAVNYSATQLGSQFYISCRGSGYALQPQVPINYYNVYSKAAYADTTSAQMIQWVDQVMVTKGWLIDRIHGIDGVGYEPVPSSRYAEQFDYIKSFENKLWVATFKEVIKYIRERLFSTLSLVDSTNSSYTLILTGPSPDTVYNVPLTLKVKLKGNMINLTHITQSDGLLPFEIAVNNGETYAIFNAIPGQTPIVFETTLITSVNSENEKLYQSLNCYPNPARSNINIVYSIVRSGMVNLEVYDIFGKKTEELLSIVQNPGMHTVQVDVKNYSPGMYFINLVTEMKKDVVKILVVR
jgi:peptidoglycan/xylan/chitin deacetylase (PgdA/CDA1 family)